MNTEALTSLVARLHKIRAEHGDEAWREAMKTFARDCMKAGGQAETFAKAMFEGLDPQLNWDDLRAEHEAAKAAPDMGAFMRALQAQLPGLKSQAQFTAFQAAFEAFRATVNGILTVNKDAEAAGKEALGKGFEVLRQATDITRKLEDVPEAATSAAAEEFKRPPAEFREYDIQRALLSELEKVTSLADLTEWWGMNRQRIDQVKSPSLRNPLIDAVREKKHRLGAS